MQASASAKLRSIPATFEPTKLAEVDRRLDAIEALDKVAIGLAIESGSRAWGFPSPDSDYDCRFIFVRRPEDYLSPWPKRDVIETPLVDDMDLNGWELGKALKLMLKGNAVVLEWLMSPITYRGDATFRDELADLARRHANRPAIARHYLHLGIRQRQTYFADDKQVALKKVFYALRPAVALRWLAEHPQAVIPPMHFQTLIGDCDIPTEVLAIAEALVARKAITNELGTGLLPPPIREFIDKEFARQADLGRVPTVLSAAARLDAEAFFRSTIDRLARQSGPTKA
ncbi:MAG: nucleotidyltransferase domain-containing protein [Pseudomonadota bacterium]